MLRHAAEDVDVMLEEGVCVVRYHQRTKYEMIGDGIQITHLVWKHLREDR